MKQFLPGHAHLKQLMSAELFQYLISVLNEYPDVIIKIKPPRKTKFGDYRALPGNRHLITINADLNRYAFIITLLHEVAHLLAFQMHGRGIRPHGKEWKRHFSALLAKAIHIEDFPQDVEAALEKHICRTTASSCSDHHLMKVLLKYDEDKGNAILLEELCGTEIFRTANGRVFRKVRLVRTRYRCVELSTNRLYSFSPFARVEPVDC